VKDGQAAAAADASNGDAAYLRSGEAWTNVDGNP